MSPWPPDVAWDALCIEGDGATLLVLVQEFDRESDLPLGRHVRAVLRSISRSIRSPIEIAPGVRYDRSDLAGLLKRGRAPSELLYEGWIFEISVDAASCILLHGSKS